MRIKEETPPATALARLDQLEEAVIHLTALQLTTSDPDQMRSTWSYLPQRQALLADIIQEIKARRSLE
jgi:ABC-type iron transport system FetAB ATPase subunit